MIIMCGGNLGSFTETHRRIWLLFIMYKKFKESESDKVLRIFGALIALFYADDPHMTYH